MECAVCRARASSGVDFHCPACARLALYGMRIKHARILLNRESIRHKIEAVAATPSSDSHGRKITAIDKAEISASNATIHHERDLAEMEDSQVRIELITRQATALKDQMQAYQRMITEEKAKISKRNQALQTAKAELATQQGTLPTVLQKGTDKISRRHDSAYQTTIVSRIELCREAADIAGLRQSRERDEDGNIRQYFSIFNYPIVDLRELNNAAPQDITVALTHFSRLVVLVCRYLHIRLPAEITIPHNDYPLSTIFAPSSSYLNRLVPFPSSSPSTVPDSSDASRTLDIRPIPRPRPLFLDKKLSVLAKEDPASYALFVEGVTLLAWDVAWLCRTQGLSVATTDWEEICPMGKNLWTLLVGGKSKPPPLLRRTTSKDDTRSKPKIARLDSNVSSKTQKSDRPELNLPPYLGVYSQGSAYNPRLFLGGAQSNLPPDLDITDKVWRFSSPVRVIDKVKAHLAADISGQEWEVLEEQEYADQAMDLAPEEAAQMQQRMTTSPGLVLQEAKRMMKLDGQEEGRQKGTSGWTVLKSRGPL